MSSTDPAQSMPEEESEVTHVGIQIVSPGKEDEEEKNQDRLKLTVAADGENPKCQLAIVCDGTTTSPYSAVAAEYVSDQVHTLFEEDGIQRTAEALKEMRAALLEKPLKIDEGQPALLRRMYEEIVRRKYENSYQTTFVAVCLKRGQTSSAGVIYVKAIGCGDSALFIFRENGELRYNNVNLDNELDQFKHGSPFTAVLPDCYDAENKNILFDFEKFPEDVHLLLCSDGFYDGFTNFREMREWLNDHRAELKDSELSKNCLLELHDKLSKKKGDDDISFIWLHPKTARVADEKEAAGREEEENTLAGNGKRARLGFFVRLFEMILHSSRLRTF